jgi:EthD domain
MIKRKPGMSKEDFDRYWSGPHADQVLECADFKRHIRPYVQSHVVAQEGIKLPWAVSEYDGQAALCFDSVEEMNAAFNEPRFLATYVSH